MLRGEGSEIFPEGGRGWAGEGDLSPPRTSVSPSVAENSSPNRSSVNKPLNEHQNPPRKLRPPASPLGSSPPHPHPPWQGHYFTHFADEGAETQGDNDTWLGRTRAFWGPPPPPRMSPLICLSLTSRDRRVYKASVEIQASRANP